MAQVDNDCGASSNATAAALAGHVSQGLVTLISSFTCIDLKSIMFMTGPHVVHSHTVHLPLGALRTPSGLRAPCVLRFMTGFRGGSAIARQLSGLRGVPQGALIVSLDDDEYIVLSDPRR